MRITFTDRLTARTANENSGFSLPVKFWDDSTETWTATTPTTVDYRIDDDRDGEILDWTTVTPASSVTITLTNDNNAIQDNDRHSEQRTVTVRANAGSSQYQDTFRYRVSNLSGQT